MIKVFFVFWGVVWGAAAWSGMGPRRLRQAVGAHFHVWRGDGRDVAAGMRARRARGLFCIYYCILFVHEL